MKSIRPSTCFVACWLALSLPAAQAQNKLPVKFGRVTPEDFAVDAMSLDSSANAVIVADVGNASFVMNARHTIDIEFHRSKRIKILTTNGFDAATIAIPMSNSSNESEMVTSLKATTYNLQDGKVVATELDSKSVYTDKINQNFSEKKFTFPALQAGSIVEYSYTLWSPFFFNLPSWVFQGKYPCLWSEYETDLPKSLVYINFSQGYLPFTINTTDVGAGGSVINRWVISHVPPLKEEPYTTSINNYVSKIEFQFAGGQIGNIMLESKMDSWNKLNDQLLQSNQFGNDLDGNNAWLKDDLKNITLGAVDDLEKAHRIYDYIRDHFACTSHNSIMLDNSLRTVYNSKSGTEADLNLLLVAMLAHEKIQADPVILSTRSHGFTNPVYPQLTNFNYVICRVTVGTSAWYLDASEPCIGFGELPSRCYNGYARLVSKDNPSAVELDADLVTETRKTTVFVSNDDKGGLVARFESSPGPKEAFEMRQNVKENGEAAFVKKLRTAYTGDMKIANVTIDSLQQPDQPLDLSYDLTLPVDKAASLFYFNPMLGEGYSENPFKSAERAYPVEMPNTMDRIYIFSMDIPDGYVVDEMPKSAKVLLNDNEGSFEYIISKDDQQIQFRTHIKLEKANYKPEDYASLRNFFALIVEKESEQIVFKKIK
jgi:hypothetical protein